MASIDFINECKNPAYENRYGKIIITGEEELNQSNVIQEFTIDSGCCNDGSIIGTAYCKKINVQLIDALNKTLENASFLTQVGIKYDNDSTEYINLGKYTIEKPKDELIDNFTSFTAYDDLANNIDKVYICNISYTIPKTLSDLYQDVCINLGLTPKTTTFLNSSIPINNNPFRNKETNRFVLETICKIAASFVDIDLDTNEIDLKWLSNNLDYTFQKNDYSTLNGGKVIYGPVNSLTIRSTSVESENVTINDSESIEEYGEHSIIIADDYILNTPQLRQQALTGIWNRLHNLQYVDCELTTYTGKPFLPIGSKIRIYTDEEEYFDTYVLQHQFTFDGTFRSVIKSPAMTEQQVAIKQDISLGERLRQTYILVDKQNGVIQSVVRDTTDTSNPDSIASKQSVLTQRVDGLESAISDIADITITGESTQATVNLNNINQSEPIVINVKPISQNISYLYPSDNLYPSDDLFMTDRIIRLHNNTTNEDIDYVLPDDLLYYDSENYDEFMLDYNSQTCKIIKKCKYNADGSVSLLDNPIINTYTYPSLELQDGDYTVSLLGYNTGYLFVRLMSKNIYTEQFYTKSETNSLINQTSSSINLSVDQKLSNYSTTQEMNSAITLKANEINSVVATKVGNNEVISKINQSSEQVSINANKVNLQGYVTVTDLATSGSTEINGDNITTGAIESNNYVPNTSGTRIDLSNGVIDSKNFKVASNGQVTMKAAKFDKGVIELESVDYSKIGIGQGYRGIQIAFDDNESTAQYMSSGLFLSGTLYDFNAALGRTGFQIYDNDEYNTGKMYCGVTETDTSSYGNIYLANTRGTQTIILNGNTGNVRCVSLTQTSKEESKKNFEKLENALEIIKNTDIYKYHLKEQDDKEKKHIGFVIGDKFKYSKEITSQENDGVDLYSMVGVCFKAIQEQQEEIEKLKEMIKNAKN